MEARFKIRGALDWHKVFEALNTDYVPVIKDWFSYWSNAAGWVDWASADVFSFGDIHFFPIGATGLDFVNVPIGEKPKTLDVFPTE